MRYNAKNTKVDMTVYYRVYYALHAHANGAHFEDITRIVKPFLPMSCNIKDIRIALQELAGRNLVHDEGKLPYLYKLTERGMNGYNSIMSRDEAINALAPMDSKFKVLQISNRTQRAYHELAAVKIDCMILKEKELDEVARQNLEITLNAAKDTSKVLEDMVSAINSKIDNKRKSSK